MNAVLDKIEKLMKLALNNPNEEEARSAALKAIKMMGEHGCRVSLGSPAPSGATSDIYRAYQDRYAQHMAAQQQEAQWWGQRQYDPSAAK